LYTDNQPNTCFHLPDASPCNKSTSVDSQADLAENEVDSKLDNLEKINEQIAASIVSLEEKVPAIFNPPRHEFSDVKQQFKFIKNKGQGDCLFFSAVDCGLFKDH
jgi:hypothetical protein